MSTVAKVLDRTRFESRARILDLLALGLLAVVGASLMLDMYYLGLTVSDAADSRAALFARDARFVRMFVELAIALAALFWIAYRLISGSARRVGG